MVILEQEPRESAGEYAERVLRYNIAHLELAPGSEVSPVELAERLGLSRMPVREALGRLCRIGLVEVRPQRGSYVARIDCALSEEVCFLRQALEVAVVWEACRGIPPQSMAALEATLRQPTPEDREQAWDAAERFHRLLFAAVGRTRSYDLLREQTVHLERLRRLVPETDPEADARRDHGDILRAIQDQDGDMAELLMTRHLSRWRKLPETVRQRFPDLCVPEREA